MKCLPLSQGKFAIVDDADYERLATLGKWTFSAQGYAYRWDRSVEPKRLLLMHRVVANTPHGLETDHINGDKLDNRRANLRVVSRPANSLNRKTRGAYKQHPNGLYNLMIMANGKQICIGRIETAEEANHIRDDIKRQLIGFGTVGVS